MAETSRFMESLFSVPTCSSLSCCPTRPYRTLSPSSVYTSWTPLSTIQSGTFGTSLETQNLLVVRSLQDSFMHLYRTIQGQPKNVATGNTNFFGNYAITLSSH